VASGDGAVSAGVRLAWLITMVALVLSVPTVALLILGAGEDTPGDGFGLGGYGGLAFLGAALVFVVTGAAIAKQASSNPISWLFCLMGGCVGTGTLAYQYADQALYVADPALPGGVTAAWLQNVLIAPAFGMLGIALLIFPDGRLPSRRWWPTPPASSSRCRASTNCGSSSSVRPWPDSPRQRPSPSCVTGSTTWTS